MTTIRWRLLALCAAAAVAPTAHATAKEALLYSFGAAPDGSSPSGGLVRDAAGNLYGTTSNGGTAGFGTVFRLSPPVGNAKTWTETVLYNFQSGADGQDPTGALAIDNAGNLYGTTFLGGSTVTCYTNIQAQGCGIAFELSPPGTGGATWTETVLHRFAGNPDGSAPNGSLVFDTAGNLYGTTAYGGAFGNSSNIAAGTVFELSPPQAGQAAWSETIIHSFNGSTADGSWPLASLTIDASGTLYGLTMAGGSGVACFGGVAGCGTAFRFTPPAQGQTEWTEGILYSFTNGAPNYLSSALVIGEKGDLYGTASNGGKNNNGAIFKLTNGGNTLPWPAKSLKEFSKREINPSGLVFLNATTLYGTTGNGGNNACTGGCGDVGTFDLITKKLTPVYRFSNKPTSGAYPSFGVIVDGAGNAYGATSAGGSSGNGTVFEIPAD